MSQATVQGVLASMRGVVTQGSAGLIYGNQDNVGGQTGTGQTDNADPQSWFISLAPDDPGQTPRLVVIVTKEKGDGGLFQAPIADCIYLNLPGYLGLSSAPLPNTRNGDFYPDYRCVP
jgi:cell division protein FtsI/penicillin-binding protein 2